MMNKTEFHTTDIFNINDVETRWRYFDFCHKEALKCGLTCKCIMDQTFMKLELWGNRCQFFKYYFKTLKMCLKKMDGVKRLASVITWK